MNTAGAVSSRSDIEGYGMYRTSQNTCEAEAHAAGECFSGLSSDGSCGPGSHVRLNKRPEATGTEGD